MAGELNTPFCPCGCGIPIANKKGVRYSDAKDDAQLRRHFSGMTKRAYKNRVKAKNDRKQRYAFACEVASRSVESPELKRDLLEAAEYLVK